jgi:hypothetical protein
MFQVLKRNFWTIGKGTEVGYIAYVGSYGLLISNKCMGFRPTTSNLSSSNHICKVSLEKLPKDKLPLLQKAFKHRLPVSCEYENEVFNSPTKGDILCTSYAIDIQIDAMIREDTRVISPEALENALNKLVESNRSTYYN